MTNIASKTTSNVTRINKIWKAADIIPLSANMQLILYKKPGSGNYLVKFLLNEKEVSIKGLARKTFPYYNWNDARTFYIQKIKSPDSGLDQSRINYLQTVK